MGQELIRVSGVLHEPKPTESRGIADARIEVVGGELAGQLLTTDRDGRFVLPPVRSTAFTLSFTKPGYLDTRVEIDRALSGSQSGGTLDVVAMPEEREITLMRSGRDDCVDLPKPPDGVPGLREYARIPVHHDGTIVVTAAQLPFSRNSGYLYRLTPSGWMKNEFDYILLRTPVPVQGGFLYLITFGEDEDRCGAWSFDATHPS
jgi:hypothetical protein